MDWASGDKAFPVCVQHGVSFEPLDMRGTERSVVSRSSDCQFLCEDTERCAHFTWYPDGGCHLSDARALKVETPDAISGQPFCKAEETAIVASQEAGWCGAEDDGRRWNHHCTTSMGQGRCLEAIHVPHRDCASGVAHLHSLKSHVWMNWCFYWHVALYFCADKAEADTLLQRGEHGTEHRHENRKYDCLVGPWNANEKWSEDRRRWCCEHEHVCGDPSRDHSPQGEWHQRQFQQKAQQVTPGPSLLAASHPYAVSAATGSLLLGIASVTIAIRGRRSRLGETQDIGFRTLAFARAEGDHDLEL